MVLQVDSEGHKLGDAGPDLSRTILLVEDDPNDVEFVRAALPPGDWVDVASSVAEARTRLGSRPHGYDVAVIDVSLPDGSGLGLLDALHPTPAVVLTGHDDPKLAERALRRGAQDYLAKDQVSADNLRRAIAFAIERRRSEGLRLQLEHSARLQQIGQMAATVAHEIGNPLTFVRSYLELAREDTLDLIQSSTGTGFEADAQLHPRLEEVGAMLEEARAGIERIRSLLGQLKTLSLPSPAASRVEPVDLVEIARSALALARARIESRSRIETTLPDTPVIVDAQPERLSQVIINFLMNATQAIEGEETTTGTIELRVTRHAPWCRVEVIDDGPGLPAGFDPGTLLRPFVSTRAHGEGCGLGLFVCEQIARSLGGRVEIGGRPDGRRGTRAALLLPDPDAPSAGDPSSGSDAPKPLDRGRVPASSSSTS